MTGYRTALPGALVKRGIIEKPPQDNAGDYITPWPAYRAMVMWEPVLGGLLADPTNTGLQPATIRVPLFFFGIATCLGAKQWSVSDFVARFFDKWAIIKSVKQAFTHKLPLSRKARSRF